MPTMIVEPDTYAARAQRAAAKRKRDRAEERRRRAARYKGWMLNAIPAATKPRDKAKQV